MSDVPTDDLVHNFEQLLKLTNASNEFGVSDALTTEDCHVHQQGDAGITLYVRTLSELFVYPFSFRELQAKAAAMEAAEDERRGREGD